MFSSRLVHSVTVRRRDGVELPECVPEYLRNLFRVMYGGKLRASLTSSSTTRFILQTSTHRYARKMNHASSKNAIAEFVEQFAIDMSDFERSVDEFETFNEFFCRALRPDARPIDSVDDPRVVVSPADCRMLVFPHFSHSRELWVKGSRFSVDSLLTHHVAKSMRARLHDCSVALARLAPMDYHRWHLPIDANYIRKLEVAGTYYSVSPRAIRSPVDVLSENKRVIYFFESPIFGLVLMVVVGAAMVGSISCNHKPPVRLRKGDEHGWFSFGGSTVILLFQKDTIEFDEDLVANTREPIETLLRVGQRIGTLKKPITRQKRLPSFTESSSDGPVYSEPLSENTPTKSEYSPSAPLPSRIDSLPTTFVDSQHPSKTSSRSYPSPAALLSSSSAGASALPSSPAFSTASRAGQSQKNPCPLTTPLPSSKTRKPQPDSPISERTPPTSATTERFSIIRDYFAPRASSADGGQDAGSRDATRRSCVNENSSSKPEESEHRSSTGSKSIIHSDISTAEEFDASHL